MDVKKWLSRAYRIDQQIQSKLEMIELWKGLANKTTANYQSTGGGKPSGYSNRLEEYCCKIVDAQTEVENQLAELIDIKREIEEVITKVKDTTLRVLLEQRYLVGKGWEEIADFMGYCTEYIKRDVHRDALRVVREIIAP